MALHSTTNKNRHVSDGVQDRYPYDFRTDNASEMFAFLDDVDITSTISSITNIGAAGGGEVIFSPVPAAGILVLTRQVPLTQTSVYKTFGKFPAKRNEADHDRSTMVDQQLDEAVRRSIKQSISVENSNLVFPEYESAAIIGWQVAEQQLQNWKVSQLPAFSVSPWAETFLQQPNEQGGRNVIQTNRVIRQPNPPTSTDDSSAGFQLSDMVHADSNNRIYRARSVAVGAAEWFQVLEEGDAPGGGGGGYAVGDVFFSIEPILDAQARGAIYLDGTPASRTGFPELHTKVAAAGYPWGTGDGSTTFGMPDMRERAAVGLGQGTDTNGGAAGENLALGDKRGTNTHILTAPELPEDVQRNLTTQLQSGTDFSVGNNTGGGQAHETRGPRMAFYAYMQGSPSGGTGGGDVIAGSGLATGYLTMWQNASLKTVGARNPADFSLSTHGHALAAAPSTNGFMSGPDKEKLDGVAVQANNYTHPNHSGDVTSDADGAQTIAANAVTTTKIANEAVTLAKMQHAAAGGVLLGRVSAATGVLELFRVEDLTEDSGQSATKFLLAQNNGANTFVKVRSDSIGGGGGTWPGSAALAGDGLVNPSGDVINVRFSSINDSVPDLPDNIKHDKTLIAIQDDVDGAEGGSGTMVQQTMTQFLDRFNIGRRDLEGLWSENQTFLEASHSYVSASGAENGVTFLDNSGTVNQRGSGIAHKGALLNIAGVTDLLARTFDIMTMNVTDGVIEMPGPTTISGNRVVGTNKGDTFGAVPYNVTSHVDSTATPVPAANYNTFDHAGDIAINLSSLLTSEWSKVIHLAATVNAVTFTGASPTFLAHSTDTPGAVRELWLRRTGGVVKATFAVVPS